MQVYVPLNTPCSYIATEAVSRQVAEDLERPYPERIISRIERAARARKASVDWDRTYNQQICRSPT